MSQLPRSSHTTREALGDYAKGPIVLATSGLVVLVSQAYGWLGGWTSSQVLALSLGMTSGMLVASGFVQVMSRRGSICLNYGDLRAGRRFIWMVLGVAGASVVAIASLVFLLTTSLNSFAPQDRLTFVLAFAALSAIWLLGGALSLANASGWLGGGLAAGLAAGLVVDRVVALFSEVHLTVASVVGFVVAMGLVAFRVNRALAPPKGVSPGRLALPVPAYLVYEAAPYFAYGFLYMVFLFIVHAVGWAGSLRMVLDWLPTVASLELGLTASLVPLLLAAGLLEHTLRLFWLRALVVQQVTSGSEPGAFGSSLRRFYWRQLIIYLVVLLVLSAAFGAVVSPILMSETTLAWLRAGTFSALELFFIVGLAGYWLLGWGQFNCMFSVTLGRPAFATRAVLWGIAAVLLIGAPPSLLLDYSYSGLALIVGAAVYVVESTRAVRRVLRAADYYYLSSF